MASILTLFLRISALVSSYAFQSSRFNYRIFGSSALFATATKYPIFCEEDVMSPKEHGTTASPVMKNLRLCIKHRLSFK